MVKIMDDAKMLDYLKKVLENMPSDWLTLTTHRLDIYDEKLAKTQFLEQFEELYSTNNADSEALSNLCTAYDYIRLGHPLSSVLEWAIAHVNEVKAENVISFSSSTTPILAVLRKNLFLKKKTKIVYTDEMPACFDADVVRSVYGYSFDLEKVDSIEMIPTRAGNDAEESVLVISHQAEVGQFSLRSGIDFYLHIHPDVGSIVLVNGAQNDSYISEIQHVRRRETIAMTPENCRLALSNLVTHSPIAATQTEKEANKASVLSSIREITETPIPALVASSGLSMQYAIVMGLIHDAMEHHPGKTIKIIVPPNCYGGTNDQARRVAACLENVEVMDLPVDGGNDMVQGVDEVLEKIASEDAVPFIIAEIPTNPRVEVPDLVKLRDALSKVRTTPNGELAIQPVFILDQTFCPNTHFLGENEILSTVSTIAYVSGSKFPSGGKCTAGFCVANQKAANFMEKIGQHLQLCDNEATDLQLEILAKQMPSMNDRIHAAYVNTREFVKFIQDALPAAKINFVSEELAKQGFTPSVFSLDLPTKGATDEEREAHKRALNLQLINSMITKIPNESKFCVSYGQLKGCYWTIPATSTQGTTKEGDKDYIVRVALSGDMDLEHHKAVFEEFVRTY